MCAHPSWSTRRCLCAASVSDRHRRKEMYSFEDKLNGEKLTLRPEGTASLVRAVTEHSLLYDGGKRLWYAGPCSAMSGPNAAVTASSTRLVPKHWVLRAGGGCKADSAGVVPMESHWLERRAFGAQQFGPTRRACVAPRIDPPFRATRRCARAKTPQRRLHSNPLRILDTKNPAMKAVVESAPNSSTSWAPSHLPADGLRADPKDANGINYSINPRLVRGRLLQPDRVRVCDRPPWFAGHRLCGRALRRPHRTNRRQGGTCSGLGAGWSRCWELVKEQGTEVPLPVPDAYAVVPDAAAMPLVLRTLQQLRDAGVRCRCMPARPMAWAASNHNSRKPTPVAPATRWCLARRAGPRQAAVKSLRDGQGVQTLRPLGDVAAWATTLQS